MLGDLGGFHDWPPRGVYFFFEPSEFRTNSGSGRQTDSARITSNRSFAEVLIVK
jgi:hypothetical protein